MLQPLQAPLKFLISYYHGTANREVTHPVPPTNHSACFPRPVHSNKSWFPHQTRTSTPPPTSYHHVIYYVTPASQSGRCLLPIKVSSTTTGNIHFSCSGTEERFAFHVPVNHTQSYTNVRANLPPRLRSQFLCR
ncbi:hypothetical protein TNCV_893011 [Trichonephila clavipes]|nr:hypothetical protein TNCV_893011 [Trichonephila clavipes]